VKLFNSFPQLGDICEFGSNLETEHWKREKLQWVTVKKIQKRREWQKRRVEKTLQIPRKWMEGEKGGGE
jgi:hypothetical protein